MTRAPLRLLLPALFASAALVACGDSETPDDAGGGGDPDAGVADTGGGGDPDTGVEADAGETPADAGTPDSGADMDAGAGPDGGYMPPTFGQWIKFEPEGARCSNGSQYKFFVNFVEGSSDVVVFFEGGGACWDYASCTGTGIRSAANRNGLPDDHASAYADFGGFELPVDVVYPLLSNERSVNPMAGWNKVFIPYCTGDVYSGDRVVTYSDPDGQEPDVEFHHVGHTNVLATVDALSEIFPQIPRMFVSGCSAGGAGSIINYHFLRSGLNPTQGYLLDDSGPIYPDQAKTAWSLPLHNRVRMSWNVDPLLQTAPQSMALSADFGELGRVLAEEYPNDRLALTQFRLDYNYSLYSYERFYEVDEMGQIVPFRNGDGLGGLGLDQNVGVDRAAVHRMWWDDTELLRAQFDARNNLGYFMPFYRDTNDSHCLTIPGFEEFPAEDLPNLLLGDFNTLAWAGTDLDDNGRSVNIKDYVEHMLDDQTPLRSHFETTPEGRYIACTPDMYDEAMCNAAVAGN